MSAVASDGPIIYLALMLHGNIYGKYDPADYNYAPQIGEIPPEFDYVGKITKNVRGSAGIYFYNPETGESELYRTILQDLNRLITDENAAHEDRPIVGQPLLDKMRDLDGVAADYYHSKTADRTRIMPQPEKMFDKHLPFYSSIDTATTREYINKEYSKNTNSLMDTQMDIYVVYQSGGPFHAGDKLLETIYNSLHSRMRRSGRGVITITLNDILYFLYTAGYKNVMLIDFSCEICADYNYNTLSADTTNVRRARRALKGYMGGRRRRCSKRTSKRKTKKNDTRQYRHRI
jgi:hypothetical protein